MAEIGPGFGASQAQVDGLATRMVAMEAKGVAFDATQALKSRVFTVQDGGADPLFAFDTSSLPSGTFVNVGDLGGCGVNGTPGLGICFWLGEWRRLSRGVTTSMTNVSRTIDTFKDPMKLTLTGALTSPRILIARPYQSALYSFTVPGVLAAATTALSVNLTTGTASDLALLGPSLNIVEYVGSLKRVDSV